MNDYSRHDQLEKRISDLGRLITEPADIEAEAIAIILEADTIQDHEIPHMTADAVIVALARIGGYSRVVEAIESMSSTFWYA